VLPWTTALDMRGPALMRWMLIVLSSWKSGADLRADSPKVEPRKPGIASRVAVPDFYS
jgi:hypothetical protein